MRQNDFYEPLSNNNNNSNNNNTNITTAQIAAATSSTVNSVMMDDDVRAQPSSGPVNTMTRGSFRVQEGLNLYVSQIPPTYNSTRLRDAFVKFGPIHSAKVMHDSLTNESRCFGFVLFEKAADGERAMAEMNGVMLEEGGGRLHVRVARPSALPQPLREDPSAGSLNAHGVDNDGGSGGLPRRISSPGAVLQPPQSPHPSSSSLNPTHRATGGSQPQSHQGAPPPPPPPTAAAMQQQLQSMSLASSASASGGAAAAASSAAGAYCYMPSSYAMGAPMGMQYAMAPMHSGMGFHPHGGMAMVPQMMAGGGSGFVPQPLQGGSGAAGGPMFYVPSAAGQPMYAPQMMVGGGAQQQAVFMAPVQSPGNPGGMVMQPFYSPHQPFPYQQWQQ